MEEIQRVAQMPDEDLSNFLNNEDEYEYEYDVATRSPDYQLLSTQNRGQTKGQSERSRSSSPKKRRRKKRNNIPQPSGKFNNCTTLSIAIWKVEIKNWILAGIMDGDKKKLPKDLDWNDVNFYKHQHEVEAMEDRDEWVKVTETQKL